MPRTDNQIAPRKVDDSRSSLGFDLKTCLGVLFPATHGQCGLCDVSVSHICKFITQVVQLARYDLVDLVLTSLDAQSAVDLTCSMLQTC